MKRYRVTAELDGHVEVMDLEAGLLRWVLRKMGARVMVSEVAA